MVVRQGLRLLVGVPLAWWVFDAVVAPEVPRVTALGAVVIAGSTLWNPTVGLALVAGLTPAGALLASPPARAAEMYAWAFLAIWLLAVWRPLIRNGTERGRAVTAPAAFYAAALAASWLMLTIGDAAGVTVPALPQFVAHALPADHLVFSSPEPQTWTLLQSVTGLALLAAAIVMTRADPRFARVLGWTLVTAIGLLAAATLADVMRQWAGVGYGGWFLLRYLRGERFSLHLADLNAAGSLYVLAGGIAAGVAIFDRARRGWAVIALVLIGPALALTGSRTSFAAAVAGVLIVAVTQRRWPLTRPQLVTAVTSLAILVLAGAAMVDWQSDVRGSAAQSASLRSQFMATSARMFASAPLSGVGIGRYFDRSAEFMPSELRAIYGNENAHNYFVQQFAELGIVGGILFAWLASALVATGWSAARRSQDPMLLGLFGGTAAYLVTCLTGHPLLVPEAAFPFWTAAGALTAAAATGATVQRASNRMPPLAVGTAVCVIVAAGTARGAMTHARADVAPSDYGFHEQETAADGSTYRWMARHAVTYMPGNGTGFVRLRLRAPERPMPRPLVVETAIRGKVVDRREIPQGRWVTYDIPSRAPASGSFQRIDLRTNEWWMQDVQLGRRQARRPITVMVADVRWIPVDEIR